MYFIQSNFDNVGNFELVMRRNGRLVHYYRFNDEKGLPWFKTVEFGESINSDPALIQSNFGERGNFEVVVKEGEKLQHYSRDNDSPGNPWKRVGTPFGDNVSSAPAFIQGNFGKKGNFELVVNEGNKLQSYYRDSDNPELQWKKLGKPFGANVSSAPALIHSNFGNKGNFEVIIREGNKLQHYFRDNDDPTYPWKMGGPPFGENVSSAPALIQSNFGDKGNFELVVIEGSKLQHYRRNNDIPGYPWERVGAPFGDDVSSPVSIIQSSFGTKGNFEVVVGEGEKLRHYYKKTDSLDSQWIKADLIGYPYAPNWDSLDQRQTPAWFQDAKFGIFVHWGVYSVPAWAPIGEYAEWYWNHLLDESYLLDENKEKQAKDKKRHEEFVDFHNRTYGKDFKYQDFAPMFTAKMFEPEAWADLFKRSGAKYVVLTSKHHEGFCLWQSMQSWNWNSVDIGPHRDLAKDLSKAVKKQGLKMGFYYSLYEWYNPLYLENLEKYVDTHMIPQMKDLVNRFKPDIFWPDGEWNHPSEKWKSQQFLAWLYNESPVRDKVAVNDRWGWGEETRGKHGGYYTKEYGSKHGQEVDYVDHPWEECRGIGGSFGFNRNEKLEHYLTSEQLVHTLVDTVSAGGNLLLNVGPTYDGRIPVIMQQRLMDIGNWLKANGEAIYGTTRWKISKEGDEVKGNLKYYTKKDQNVYAICIAWPGTSLTLTVPQPNAVFMLGHDNPLKWQIQNNQLVIDLSTLSIKDITSQYAFVFKLVGVQ